MASSNNDKAGTKRKDEDAPTNEGCSANPGTSTTPANTGKCEPCVESLKKELDKTRDLLLQSLANERQKDRELILVTQKLVRLKKEAKKTRTELDERMAKIVAEAVEAQTEVNARLDDVTQKVADIKLCLTEKLPGYATGAVA